MRLLVCRPHIALARATIDTDSPKRVPRHFAGHVSAAIARVGQREEVLLAAVNARSLDDEQLAALWRVFEVSEWDHSRPK
jgi:hypothetical protein